MSQVDSQLVIADSRIAILGTAYASFVQNGNVADAGGAIIPTQTNYSSLGFGDGDLIHVGELCVSTTATPPDAPVSYPANFASYGDTNTWTDQNGRGVRLAWGSMRMTDAHPGTRFKLFPVSAAVVYRQTMLRAFYMSRPVRAHAATSGAIDHQNGGLSSISVPAATDNGIQVPKPYELEIVIANMFGTLLSDIQTIVTPAKGTEYFGYRATGGTTREQVSGTDGVSNSAKSKWNSYERDGPFNVANFFASAADTGAVNCVVGAAILVR